MIPAACVACIAHNALAQCEEMKKVTHFRKCNWQQNSENLQKLRDRISQRERQG